MAGANAKLLLRRLQMFAESEEHSANLIQLVVQPCADRSGEETHASRQDQVRLGFIG